MIRPGQRRWGAVPARLLAVGLASVVGTGWAAEPADAWLEVEAGAPGQVGDRSLFESLAGAVPSGGGRLSVVWEPPVGVAVPEGDGGVTLEASTGAPGHWASRDWRSSAMARVDGGWRASVPLVSGVEPVVYRVRHVRGAQTNTSPARVFRPGLVDPPVTVGPFSGLVDGFEDGIGGWSGTVPGVKGGLAWTDRALTGRGGLRIEVPGQRASMTVGTVRLQGWMLAEHGPRAVRFAARTEGGEGRVGCALHGHAGTDRVAVFPAKGEFRIGPEWRRLEVPLAAFAGLRPGEVDWMTIQFRAESGRALVVDDVELVLR